MILKRQTGVLMGLLLVFGLAIVAVLSTGQSVVHSQGENNCPPARLPQANLWETDWTIASIDCNEMLWGGVPRDGIPPIDNPDFITVDEAQDQIAPQSPVVAVEVNGIARAYPLGVLTRHEIVNDMFDTTPVAVTFCPLCNSAIAFERQVDGRTLRLGVSGMLRNSDLVMWDDRTESLWQQLTGEAIIGEYTGEQLTILPSQVVGFGAFAAEFPDGEVLVSRGRISDINPYENYDMPGRAPFLFDGEFDDRIDNPTARVLAGTIGGEPIAYPFDVLFEERLINDVVGERPVVAFWQPGATSALDDTYISESRDVGMAVLYSRYITEEDAGDAVDAELIEDGRVTLGFALEDGAIVDLQTGSVWNIFGRAEDGPLAGVQLRQELAAPHFWFAWAAFEPETAVYGIDDS